MNKKTNDEHIVVVGHGTNTVVVADCTRLHQAGVALGYVQAVQQFDDTVQTYVSICGARAPDQLHVGQQSTYDDLLIDAELYRHIFVNHMIESTVPEWFDPQTMFTVFSNNL